MDAFEIGKASLALGAGRETKESPIDPLAGIRLLKKVGDPVEKGEALAILYARDEAHCLEGISRIRQAYAYSPAPVETEPLIKKIITIPS